MPVEFHPDHELPETMEAVFAALHHGSPQGTYRGVFIGSLTEIQKACMDHILEKTKKDAMEMRDWGALAMKIEAWSAPSATSRCTLVTALAESSRPTRRLARCAFSHAPGISAEIFGRVL